jgi:tetratricopeptide (TPR) repeat protein
MAEAQLARGDAAGAVATLRSLADSPAARSEDLALMVKAARAAGDPGAAGYEARSRQPQAQAVGRDLADADAAMRAGNWAGAAQAYRRIMGATDGRNVMVLNNFAYAQTMLGNHAEAIDLADKALGLAPDSASVLDTAGFARLKAGKDLEKAKSLLRRAAQQAPQNVAIATHLAEAERAGR